jgi:hypothetical protein
MSSVLPDTKGDPEIESILAQPTGDWRLGEINRRMYESLHALDVALRREQRIAACERPALQAHQLLFLRVREPAWLAAVMVVYLVLRRHQAHLDLRPHQRSQR